MMKEIIVAATLSTSIVGAVTITYNLDHRSAFGSSVAFVDSSNVPLSGSLIELGYFTGETSTFTGDWTPLTPSNTSDAAALAFNLGAQDDGYYNTAAGIDFDTSPGNAVPNGTRLAIRFYDSPDNRGNFNTVTDTSNSAWLWPIDPNNTPSQPQGPFTLRLVSGVDTPTSSLVWENGAASAFQAVPEPSSLVLSSLGACLLLGRRKRS